MTVYIHVFIMSTVLNKELKLVISSKPIQMNASHMDPPRHGLLRSCVLIMLFSSNKIKTSIDLLYNVLLPQKMLPILQKVMIT
ncbi:hypothetical protein D3C81_355810 [compost metagenome]